MSDRKAEQLRVFSKRLRDCMQNSGMIATDLANATGIGKSDISNYMTGKYLPKQDRIYLLSKALDADPAWLSGLDLRIDDPLYKPRFEEIQVGHSARRIPLIGAAAAGVPIYDEEVDTYIYGPVNADCAVRVKGDSMTPTYLHGDLLYVRSQSYVDYDGQIAVVICGDEACVKHVYRQPDGLLLASDNAMFAPMLKKYADYDGTIRILGKVIGFTRMYQDQ